MGVTTIEWTDRSWNSLRGCSRVSEGCRFCYAEGISARFSGPGKPYAGVARMNRGLPQWTGQVRLIEKHLRDPISWRKPQRIFVNSMSDTFHEEVPFEAIDRIFAVMLEAPQHIYQMLTKRTERMMAFSTWWMAKHRFEAPPAHIWWGTSVENQLSANERIPALLATNAAVRFLSVEPLLEPVNLRRSIGMWTLRGHGHPTEPGKSDIHWVIVGGESGGRARETHIGWVEDVVQQCRAARVACFVKQLGSVFARRRQGECLEPEEKKSFMVDGSKHFKGGCMLEWPEGLRIREMPASSPAKRRAA